MVVVVVMVGGANEVFRVVAMACKAEGALWPIGVIHQPVGERVAHVEPLHDSGAVSLHSPGAGCARLGEARLSN